MTQQYSSNTLDLICFLSSTKILEYKPAIVLTTNSVTKGKYIYTIHPKAYIHLDAVKNRSNEELIKFLESEGFTDAELFEVEGRIGFNLKN
ncbi:hypothetical protein [Nostoc sp. FACHB-280]|uniref:hypothetical protein n=1 Tax=Nostoc sp. FACHB-280 TaxID=2692839 RepID=UPI00168BA22C|nr:hypothetical protein [Nostoc sp. FACHB-280]MBD2493639.1 hypothetical protein [Nostoc sp. FACHB-280]